MSLSQNKLVTVIESNFLLRRSLARVLISAGYTTESFATAEEFLPEAAACKAACVVLDIEMKDGSGLTLARHPTVMSLRCPIVFTCGTISEVLEREARELGGTALVRKPFEEVDILSAIFKATTPR
jgi:FixJ family two-component response regulator